MICLVYVRIFPLVERATGKQVVAASFGDGVENRRAFETARAELNSSLLDASALRKYALAAEELGDKDGAGRAMAFASTLGWRDTPTQLWLFRRALRTGDARSAVLHADGLARRNQALDIVIPFLVAVGLDPDTRRYVIERMLHRPNWRSRFYGTLRQVESAEKIITFFEDFKKSGGTVAADELNPVMITLAGQGKYQLARTLLTMFNPSSGQSLIVDGDFASLSENGSNVARHPFEWQVMSSGRATSYIGLPSFSPDDPALAMQWRGSINAPFAAQTLSLPAGDYLISVSLTGDRVEDESAFAIEFNCLPDGAAHRPARARSQRGDPWSLVQYKVSVPAVNCGAQRLVLVANSQTAGDHSVWIDRVSIADSEAASRPAQSDIDAT